MPNVADTIPPSRYLSGGTEFGRTVIQSEASSELATLLGFQSKQADTASATTVVLSSATGNWGNITGTTTITAITLAVGQQFLARFTGALLLTHSASLVLPSAADITTAAGDFALFVGDASGVTRAALYARADGTALVTSTPASLDIVGSINTDDVFKVDDVQVVGPQDLAVPAPVGGVTQDAEAREAIGLIIARLVTHGLISPEA